MAKAKRKQRSRQVKSYSLDDLEQLEKPTDERRRRGVWSEYKSKDRTERHERDVTAHPIDALEWDGVITSEQAQAGRDYEALMARTRLVSQGRSCLDMTPVGYGDGDHDDPQSWRSLKELEGRLGLFRSSLLRRVITGWRLLRMEPPYLREALDIAQEHFSGGRR